MSPASGLALPPAELSMVLPPGHKQQKKLGSRAHTTRRTIPTDPHLVTQELNNQEATKRRGAAPRLEGCLAFQMTEANRHFIVSQLLPESLAQRKEIKNSQTITRYLHLNNCNKNIAQHQMPSWPGHKVSTSAHLILRDNLIRKFQKENTHTKKIKNKINGSQRD